jgi:hypothetical protein
MKKHKFTKTERMILDRIEEARLEGNKGDYWSTFKMPWSWVANAHFWPDGKREKDACESLVARGFLVEVNRNIFVKNYRAPK